jgi:hypothetical protein
VEQLADDFATGLRRGEHLSLTEYIEHYPDLADDIRELFPMLAMVEQFKPAQQDGVVPPAQAEPARGAHPEQMGDCRILRYLGEGGMGVVYEAVRDSLRHHVALEVMHPQFRNRQKYLSRFLTEAGPDTGSLRRTVTLGLLTDTYQPAGCTPELPHSQDAAPALTPSPAGDETADPAPSSSPLDAGTSGSPTSAWPSSRRCLRSCGAISRTVQSARVQSPPTNDSDDGASGTPSWLWPISPPRP